MSDSIKRAPLEDLMVAMDVVDTLRHRDKLVAQASNAAGRRESLLQQLRDIYSAQGIEVTDAMLEEGVRALEEDRFAYEPAPKTFSTRLAKFYIRRRHLSKPFLMFASIITVALIVNYFGEVRPAAKLREDLPIELNSIYEQIISISNDNAANQQAQSLLSSAQAAIDNDELDAAEADFQRMEGILDRLEQSYQVRVVSRPGEMSGAWRIPDVNSNARNFYLIVEAVDSNGSLLSLPITNEENGRTETVRTWGVRVDEATFNAVGADKQDDGIIQRNIVGSKDRGSLQPTYSVTTTGGMITEW